MYQFKWPSGENDCRFFFSVFFYSKIDSLVLSCVFTRLLLIGNHSSTSLVRFCAFTYNIYLLFCSFDSLIQHQFYPFILPYSIWIFQLCIGVCKCTSTTTTTETATAMPIKRRRRRRKNQFQGYGLSVLFSLTSISHAI